MKQKLIKLLEKSYSPYSNVQVSAILVTKKGDFFGVNIENSAYPSGLCAERVCIFGAVAQGTRQKDILELHLISSLEKYLYPCGACLQVMSEFFKRDVLVHVYNKNTSEVKKYFFHELIPFGVTKEDFGWE